MNRLFSVSRSSSQFVSSKARMSINKVSHVIFDMDGLLLDTETLYTKVYQSILDPHGKVYTWDVKQSLMGAHAHEAAKIMVKTYDLPITWEEFAEQAKTLTTEIMRTATFLPDTEDIYEGLVRDIAKMYNKPYPYDTRIRILGTTEQMTAKIAVNELQLPITVDQFRERFSELGRKRLRNVTWLRGAERLLKHLHETNVPFALATSSSKEIAEIKMANHSAIFDLFHHKVMGSTDPDVKVGKPAPDIFLVAAQRFPDKPDPANCLVFEDAPNGVRAACLAGMQSVMVPDKKVVAELREEATIVIDSLEDIQLELFGLPPLQKV